MSANPHHRQQLHPNLARVAASYAEIVEQFARAELTAPEANRRVSELVARDDNGLRWAINPTDGSWMYQSAVGEWKPGDPPTSGVATLTPHDITNHTVAGGRTGVANPDDLIDFTRATPEMGSDGLVGATYKQAAKLESRNNKTPSKLSKKTLMALVAIAAVVVGVLYMSMSGSDEAPDQPEPAQDLAPAPQPAASQPDAPQPAAPQPAAS